MPQPESGAPAADKSRQLRQRGPGVSAAVRRQRMGGSKGLVAWISVVFLFVCAVMFFQHGMLEYGLVAAAIGAFLLLGRILKILGK